MPSYKHKNILQVWVCVASHAQSTQNKTFAISEQYLKGNVEDEVDFLPADEFHRFLQIDAIILGVCDQACSSYPK